MSFTPKVWQNRREGMTTPLSALALIDLETRLSEYSEAVKAAEVVDELPVATAELQGQFRMLTSEEAEDQLYVCIWNGSEYEWRLADAPTTLPDFTLHKHVVGELGEPAYASGWSAPDADLQSLQYSQDGYGTVQMEGYIKNTVAKVADSNVNSVPLAKAYRPMGDIESASNLPYGRLVMNSSGLLTWTRDRWPYENTANGLADTTVPTTVNTGGESGDAVAQVVNDTPLTVSTQTLGNSLLKRCYKALHGVTALEAHLRYVFEATNRVWGRMYFRYPTGFLGAGIGGTHRLVRFMSGSSIGLANIAIRADQASPTLRFLGGVNGSEFLTGNPAYVFLVETNYRIEWDITFGAGTARLEARIFAGANVNGLIPDDSVLLTGQTTNDMDQCDAVTFGNVLLGAPSLPFYFGGFNLNTEDFPGPYVGLKPKDLPVKTNLPVSIALVPDYTPVALPPFPAEAEFMFQPRSVIEAMPTDTAGYAWMEDRADAMMARGLSVITGTPGSKSPLLSNYNDSDGTTRQTECLANALLYIRHVGTDPTGANARRDRVIAYLRYVIGTEEVDSTIGTSVADRSLAVGRALAGYILAADLIGFDKSLTGTRAGWTTVTWEEWLNTIPTKILGTVPNKYTWELNFKLGTNHGTMIMASNIALAIHLEDDDRLIEAVNWMKRYTGETYLGDKWTKTSSLRESWVCAPDTSLQDFVPINPSKCGTDLDGIMPEEICRNGLDFPNFGTINSSNSGINYSFEALTGALLAAVLLYRRGYTDVWDWGASASGDSADEQAFARAVGAMDRLGVSAGNGRVMNHTVAWIVNHYSGTTYPKNALAKNSASHGFWDALWPEDA